MSATAVAAVPATQLGVPSHVASLAAIAPRSGGLIHAAASPGWFEAGSLSFEWAKGLPVTLVTLVIGVIAAYIAWSQFQVAAEQRRLAQAKLNLDLFQRRYEVFELTWSMLS